MSVYQGKITETLVRLTSSGSAVTGVLYSAVTAKLKKFGATTFTTKVLISADWLELEAGYYILKWSAADMNTLGLFVYALSGGSFDAVHASFDVDPTPIAYQAAADVCIVSGNIITLGAKPGQGLPVEFQILETPLIIGGASFVTTERVSTTPDPFGNFSVALVRGATVMATIPRIGLKQVITVPDAPSANIIALLPP